MLDNSFRKIMFYRLEPQKRQNYFCIVPDPRKWEVHINQAFKSKQLLFICISFQKIVSPYKHLDCSQERYFKAVAEKKKGMQIREFELLLCFLVSRALEVLSEAMSFGGKIMQQKRLMSNHQMIIFAFCLIHLYFPNRHGHMIFAVSSLRNKMKTTLFSPPCPYEVKSEVYF